MLALSLEKLSLTSQADDIDVKIFLDYSSEQKLDETEYVREQYFPRAEINHAGMHVVAPSGTWNILQSLKSGYESGADFVHLVEEDVFVKSNYFDMHEQLQSEGGPFVTCGRTHPNQSNDFFTNPGSCYKREKLSTVVPHISLSYFADLGGYLEKHFPGMDDLGILDDGLIRRVIRSVNGKVKCANPPICFHQGFHYYGKLEPWITKGNIKDRVNQLRKMLPLIKPEDRYCHDFEPFQD
jgi:hypothetical protein